MRNVRLLFLAAAMLTLAACYPPTTSHPIGSTVGLKIDPALLGVWKAPDPNSNRTIYYHLLSAKDGAIFAVLIPDQGQASDVSMLKLKAARFGNFGFLNVRLMMDAEHEAPDQPAGSVPILYRLQPNGTLKIFGLDEDAAKKAINTHKIAGTTGEGGNGDAVITADAAALDKFFRSPAGLALFDKLFATLTKVK